MTFGGTLAGSGARIRSDEMRKAEAELEAKLLAGLGSPESELTGSDWSAIRNEAMAKIATAGERAE